MDHLHKGTQDIHALIVDDDDVDREKLLRLLRRVPRNITVAQAASQAEALDMIRDPQAHFDIVFLDFGLKDGDGRDLLPEIRAEIDPDVPIIAVTGHTDEQIAADSIKSGMTEFLSKRSLSPERVAASVEEGSPGANTGRTCAARKRN
ncbi:response regulator [Novosphingobium resinovorum]